MKRRLSADVVNPQVDLPKRTSSVGGTRVGFLVRQAARTDSERRGSGFPQAGGENRVIVIVAYGEAPAASWAVPGAKVEIGRIAPPIVVEAREHRTIANSRS